MFFNFFRCDPEPETVYVSIEQSDIPETLRMLDQCRSKNFSNSIDVYNLWSSLQKYVDKGIKLFHERNFNRYNANHYTNILYELDTRSALNPRIKFYVKRTHFSEPICGM